MDQCKKNCSVSMTRSNQVMTLFAGFIPFFHSALGNVKAGNQSISFPFFDFGDIPGGRKPDLLPLVPSKK